MDSSADEFNSEARSGAPVVVVGAGLAGLAAARSLNAAGRSVVVLESSNEVGGRVRTDELEADGGLYRIDRGFQIYLDSYPEGRRLLDHGSLQLGRFYPGAKVWADGRMRRLADPRRRLLDSIGSLGSGLVGFGDAMKLAKLHRSIMRGSVERVWSMPERTTAELFAASGLSDGVVARVLKPFYAGVFFDPELRTSARMFAFTYRMFATGSACLPAGGMARIPAQMASALPAGTVRLGEPVSSVAVDHVVLRSGDRIDASAVVVAVDQTAASTLVPELGLDNPDWQSTTTLAFAAEEPPVDGPMLVLDGAGEGPVNHLAVPSVVAGGYAPAGKHLVLANVVGRASERDDDELLRSATEQMARWFGGAARRWRWLTTVRVPHALPSIPAPALSEPKRPVRLDSGVFVCGDWRENPSINGAMASGRRAAEAVVSGGDSNGA